MKKFRLNNNFENNGLFLQSWVNDRKLNVVNKMYVFYTHFEGERTTLPLNYRVN